MVHKVAINRLVARDVRRSLVWLDRAQVAKRTANTVAEFTVGCYGCYGKANFLLTLESFAAA